MVRDNDILETTRSQLKRRVLEIKLGLTNLT